MFHITNGDATAAKLRQCGIGGTVLPWRDVLHEGPVPADLPLPELSRRRARFIAAAGWADERETRQSFAARDAALARFHDHEAVLLWFEHDLYDQLQLIQILDWFADHELRSTTLSLICIDAFPGRAAFRGLGELSPTELSSLPFLVHALARHLEQFPAVDDGLSRTERQILDLVAAGVRAPMRLFQGAQELEERPFMGDNVFWMYLSRLTSGPRPLLQSTDRSDVVGCEADVPRHPINKQLLTITSEGEAVRGGKSDWRASPADLRWLGGVRVESDDLRWDRRRRRLVTSTADG